MMNETTARRLWDFTRGLAAYSLPTWARDDLVARRKNQYANRVGRDARNAGEAGGIARLAP